MSGSAPSSEHRAANGIFFRIVGQGEPLLLLHGLMVDGTMFDPLVALLKDRFRMLIPDLRGHGRSGDLGGPYDVATLAADLDAVLAEAGSPRTAVLGYSHGGAVAQQLARRRPGVVKKLLLSCTFACFVATPRQRFEAGMLLRLLWFLSPGALGKLMLLATGPRMKGARRLTPEQGHRLLAIMAGNRAIPMRGAVRGLIAFDSRAWLGEIGAPTLVIGGTDDIGVPQHHFDALLGGIPGARGHLVAGAGHMLAWTHTKDFAEFIRAA